MGAKRKIEAINVQLRMVYSCLWLLIHIRIQCCLLYTGSELTSTLFHSIANTFKCFPNSKDIDFQCWRFLTRQVKHALTQLHWLDCTIAAFHQHSSNFTRMPQFFRKLAISRGENFFSRLEKRKWGISIELFLLLE